MRKIPALYLNEMIKVIRKPSFYIILGVMVAVVFAFGGLMKAESNASQSNLVRSEELGIQKQQMQETEDNFKKQLSDVQSKIKTASASELPSLKQQEISYQSQIDLYEYAISHDIVLGGSSYLAQALQQLYQLKGDVATLKALPSTALTAEQESELDTDSDFITRLQDSIDKKDFSAYISVANDLIDHTASLTADEKTLQKQTNDLKLRLNATGEGNLTMQDALNQQISKIESDRRSLLYNIDYSQSGSSSSMKSLTSDRRREISNDIVVTTYKLEHHIGTQNSGTNYADTSMGVMEYIGTFVLVILMLILAGSTVSQEIATGSIKSLIIAPVRRWKILTAKILSLLTMLILSALALYAATLLANGIYFGFGACTPYVYASGGAAHMISFPLYYLGYLFVSLAEAVVLLVFALMLSVLTRNTAASVGISMGIYFAGSLINSIITNFFKSEWVDFLPFNNMDLNSLIFPSNALSQSMTGSAAVSSASSLNFHLIYLGVLVLCMGLTAYDSFIRRDIR